MNANSYINELTDKNYKQYDITMCFFKSALNKIHLDEGIFYSNTSSSTASSYDSRLERIITNHCSSIELLARKSFGAISAFLAHPKRTTRKN